MNKFNSNKVSNQTLKLCVEMANKETYITAAPLTIYQRIRSHLTTTQAVTQVVELGFPQELVDLVHLETFKEV